MTKPTTASGTISKNEGEIALTYVRVETVSEWDETWHVGGAPEKPFQVTVSGFLGGERFISLDNCFLNENCKFLEIKGQAFGIKDARPKITQSPNRLSIGDILELEVEPAFRQGASFPPPEYKTNV